VLGPSSRQLNREIQYPFSATSINQLVAWSGWGLLDTRIDNTRALLAPRLASITDESASLEERVRSYWDGNCAMCHAGANGVVPGWDARFTTPFDEEGLDMAPRRGSTDDTLLIKPGAPERSFIYQRGNTVDGALRMPPLGRNRVDEAYVDVLARWIASLE
jgi:mono/diheme cytochrome c family protein